MKSYSYTHTETYTRTEVLNDHFELFLKCGGMSKDETKKILSSASKGELQAVGVYFEIGGYRQAEVEFSVDWEKHENMIGIHGKLFDSDRPGWENGVSPEAYIAVQHLVDYARAEGCTVKSWIRVSQIVRNNKEWHRDVCERLGYCINSSPVPWKETPAENVRTIHYLEEAKVIQRRSQ